MKHLLTLLCMGILALTWHNLLGQEVKSSKEVHLQIEKIVNGETVLIDTTFVFDNSEDMQEVLGQIDSSIDIEIQDGDHTEKEIRVEKIITVDGEGQEEVHVSVSPSNTTWTTDEGVSINVDGNAVFIQGDEEGHIQHHTFKGEDGKKGYIFIQQSDEITEEDKAEIMNKYDQGELGEILEEVIVNVETDQEGEINEHIQIKVFTRHCRIEDCGKADWETLMNTGKKRAELESGLSVQDLSFYPNPNDGKFRLQFSSEQEGSLEISIRDIMGKTVLNQIQSSFSGQYDDMINLTDIAAGIYFLTISHQKQALTKKIIIEQ